MRAKKILFFLYIWFFPGFFVANASPQENHELELVVFQRGELHETDLLDFLSSLGWTPNEREAYPNPSLHSHDLFHSSPSTIYELEPVALSPSRIKFHIKRIKNLAYMPSSVYWRCFPIFNSPASTLELIQDNTLATFQLEEPLKSLTRRLAEKDEVPTTVSLPPVPLPVPFLITAEKACQGSLGDLLSHLPN